MTHLSLINRILISHSSIEYLPKRVLKVIISVFGVCAHRRQDLLNDNIKARMTYITYYFMLGSESGGQTSIRLLVAVAGSW